MGTNYYFEDKNKKEIYKQTIDNVNKKLDEIRDLIAGIIVDEDYLERVYENIEEGTSFYYETRYHIGKQSNGWKFLFQKTEYYSNLSELIDFYNKKKDNLTIIDEYGEVLDIYDLYKVFSESKNDKSHTLEFNDVYTDRYDYEWAEHQFT